MCSIYRARFHHISLSLSRIFIIDGVCARLFTLLVSREKWSSARKYRLRIVLRSYSVVKIFRQIFAVLAPHRILSYRASSTKSEIYTSLWNFRYEFANYLASARPQKFCSSFPSLCSLHSSCFVSFRHTTGETEMIKF